MLVLKVFAYSIVKKFVLHLYIQLYVFENGFIHSTVFLNGLNNFQQTRIYYLISNSINKFSKQYKVPFKKLHNSSKCCY